MRMKNKGVSGSPGSGYNCNLGHVVWYDPVWLMYDSLPSPFLFFS
jgi:hypothetical protein